MVRRDAHEHPWGQTSFDEERWWFNKLGQWHRTDYNEQSQRAKADSEYDLFQNFTFDKPKLAIGRYVARNQVDVPFIQSMAEWQHAMDQGTAMLRSEHLQDYAGMSGLVSSYVLPSRNNDTDFDGMRLLLNGFNISERLGSAAVNERLLQTLMDGLYDGSVNPAAFMKLRSWNEETAALSNAAHEQRYTIPHTTFTPFDVSRWKYIPGINLKVFRDPVVEGRYYIGGREDFQSYVVNDGRNSPNLEAKGYNQPNYVLPTKKIIDLYEKVRTLPYFDNRQVPFMEMQYGFDAKLYFLQYLRTGHMLNDPGEFALPSSPTSVQTPNVRGATGPEGETIRIYIDPMVNTRRMARQGIFMSEYMGGDPTASQYASIMARVAIVDTTLAFKDNHNSSAPLYRPNIGIGLRFRSAEDEPAYKLFHKLSDESYDYRRTGVSYIDANITSNGRQAVIDSDWILKREELN